MYSMFYLKEANKYFMGKIEWKIRFLWRMLKHTNKVYAVTFGWHAYSRSPEQTADQMAKRAFPHVDIECIK